MKWKKMISLLLVAVIASSLFAVLGSSPVSADEYVTEIRLEVRSEQSVGVGDTATGVLDAFLQAVDGTVYDRIPAEWKQRILPLESYGSYTEMTYNTAWTEDSRMVLDTVGNGDPNDFVFNPFSIREIRHATNHIIDRQFIVENIYDGFSVAQYQAIATTNPSYDDELLWIDEEFGITYSGDFDRGYQMIQDAMTDAMNDPSLEGDLRPPAQSPTQYWQYRPPGGSWSDVSLPGLIRIEDSRLQIGRIFSDLLGDCGIHVDRFEADRVLINVWLFTDPADWQWGFYTGGWISSVTVAYQHGVPIQFYTDYNGFMPGGFFGAAGRYYYLREEAYAEPLILDYALPLAMGQVPDEETYWEYVAEISYVGVYQSSRIFLETSADVVPLNRDAVTEVATDATTGWAQFFSPRTLKTTDGTFTAAQFSATGHLYMDNWNDIHGSADYYSVLAQRMSWDPGTTLNPATGTSIPMRADYIADSETVGVFNARYGESISEGEFMLRMDYDFDADGDLVSNLDAPSGSDVWFYDVQTEEWINGAHTYDPDTADLVSVDKVATAVTYNYHLGTWHSGHDVTLRDILASHAFSKQLSYDESWGALGGAYFHTNYATTNRPWFQNVHAIEIVDAEEGIVTYYGDYTFPAETEICGYYGSFPMHPWQLYEAVTHLRGETAWADSGATPHDRYEWTNIAGTNYVHWIDSTQTIDFMNTLKNLAGEGGNDVWIPPYLQNGPAQITEAEHIAEINAITSWQDDVGLSWIATGPFRIVRYDTANLVVEMERHTVADGYPLADDYWRDRLYIAALRHGTMTSPIEIDAGDSLTAEVRVRVFEEYPAIQTKNLRHDDAYESVLTVYDEFGLAVYENTDPTYVNSAGSYLRVTIPGGETSTWDEGWYELEFVSGLEGQVFRSVTTRSVYVNPSAAEIVNHELTVSPTAGRIPLTVTITAYAENTGTAAGTVDILVDGAVIGDVEIPAGGSATGTETFTFEEEGVFEVSFGPLTREVTATDVPVVDELDNYELTVTPTTGTPPLTVTIEYSVENIGDVGAEDHIYVNAEPVRTVEVPAGETVDGEFTHEFTAAGIYVIEWGEEEVSVSVTDDEEEANLVDLSLNVDPTKGEKDLTVTITVSARNTGGADGSIDVVIDGTTVYTLNVPAEGENDHEFEHTFTSVGDSLVEFGDESVIVTVEDEDSPGFMFVLLALSAVFAVVIYHKKKQ